MRIDYVLHIAAGTAALLTGFVALYAAKGGTVHRKSGIAFVYAMLALCFLGALMAAVRQKAPAVNIPAATLTAYLVITGLATVRAPARWPHWLNSGLMFVALAVGLTTLALGFDAIANGGTRKGIPAFPFFMFAVVGMLASAGDRRMIRSGGLASLRGAPRLARHLWRMCFALFIATMSFFLGQAKVIPKPIRIPALLALPVLAVLLTMMYWMWRVRVKRRLHGIIRVSAPEAAR